MAKALPLHVVVLDLADALDAQRLPREIFPGAPAALTAGHPLHFAAHRLRPFAPRMVLEGVLAQRRQLRHQLPPRGHRERRGDADVMERAFGVVETEQQRADAFVLSVLWG